MSADTIKIPDPIIEPATTIDVSKSDNVGLNCSGGFAFCAAKRISAFALFSAIFKSPAPQEKQTTNAPYAEKATEQQNYGESKSKGEEAFYGRQTKARHGRAN